jgi:hypothetical protein
VTKENEEQEVLAGQSGSEAPFTQNDLSFLRSLRISVAGDEEDISQDTK